MSQMERGARVAELRRTQRVLREWSLSNNMVWPTMEQVLALIDRRCEFLDKPADGNQAATADLPGRSTADPRDGDRKDESKSGGVLPNTSNKADADASPLPDTPSTLDHVDQFVNTANMVTDTLAEVNRLRDVLKSIADCGMLVGCETCKAKARMALRLGSPGLIGQAILESAETEPSPTEDVFAWDHDLTDVAKEMRRGQHLAHCFQGENEGCKYGYSTCPAETVVPAPELPHDATNIRGGGQPNTSNKAGTQSAAVLKPPSTDMAGPELRPDIAERGKHTQRVITEVDAAIEQEFNSQGMGVLGAAGQNNAQARCVEPQPIAPLPHAATTEPRANRDARAEIQRIRDEAEIVSEFLRVGPIDSQQLARARESFYRIEIDLLDYYEMLAKASGGPAQGWSVAVNRSLDEQYQAGPVSRDAERAILTQENLDGTTGPDSSSPLDCDHLSPGDSDYAGLDRAESATNCQGIGGPLEEVADGNQDATKSSGHNRGSASAKDVLSTSSLPVEQAIQNLKASILEHSRVAEHMGAFTSVPLLLNRLIDNLIAAVRSEPTPPETP